MFVLLEYASGGGLQKNLRINRCFSQYKSTFAIAQIYSAISHLHSRKILYRDIKPENIVIDERGYLKLVDFGLSKVIGSGRTSTICGTPDYFAPEVVRGEKYGFGVDYWALGVLFY